MLVPRSPHLPPNITVINMAVPERRPPSPLYPLREGLGLSATSGWGTAGCWDVDL